MTQSSGVLPKNKIEAPAIYIYQLKQFETSMYKFFKLMAFHYILHPGSAWQKTTAESINSRPAHSVLPKVREGTLKCQPHNSWLAQDTISNYEMQPLKYERDRNVKSNDAPIQQHQQEQLSSNWQTQLSKITGCDSRTADDTCESYSTMDSSASHASQPAREKRDEIMEADAQESELLDTLSLNSNYETRAPTYCLIAFIVFLLTQTTSTLRQVLECRFLLHLILILGMTHQSVGVDNCFSGSRLPKIYQAQTPQEESFFWSITGNAQSIFIGGATTEPQFTDGSSTDATAIITRMELETLTVVWSMYYKDISQESIVEGLALDPSNSKLAVYARIFTQDFDEGNNEGRVFIVDANDGHIISKDTKIIHDSNSQFQMKGTSDQMHFDGYGKVHIAFYLTNNFGVQHEQTLDANGPQPYEGKLRIARIDTDISNAAPVDYYYRQHGWFGNVKALVFKDNGSAVTSKVYLGGSSDPAHVLKNDPTEYSPSITMLNYDGQFEKGWRLRLDTNYETAAYGHTMIGTMKLVTLTTGTEAMIGTTLSRNIWNTGAKFYVYRVFLDSGTNDLDPLGLTIYKIDVSSGMINDNYILGIASLLVNDCEIHAILYDKIFQTNKDLYYFIVDMDNGSNSATILYKDINWAQVTYFDPTNSNEETIGSINARNSYTVGYARDLTSDIPSTVVGSLDFGIVLPSHVSKSCLEWSHTQTSFPSDLQSNAAVIELQADGTNEIFESCLTASGIEYDQYELRNVGIDYSNMLGDDWCSVNSAHTVNSPSESFSWGCQISWGDFAISKSFDPPTISGATPTSCGCEHTDNGALSSNGNSCSNISNPLNCGLGDDNDFTGGEMCCQCGGGQNDTPKLFNYWLEETSAVVDDQHFRIGIDGVNQQITAEALASGIGNTPREYTFNAHYMAPDGQTGSFAFTINVEDLGDCTLPNCDSSTIFCTSCEPNSVTPTTEIDDQSYVVGSDALITPAFAYTISPLCAVSYSTTISPVPADPNLIVFDQGTQTFTVDGSDLALSALYTVTVEVITYGGTSYGQWSFTVDVINPCLSTTFVINPTMISSSSLYDTGEQYLAFSIFGDQELIPIDATLVSQTNAYYDLNDPIQVTQFASTCPYLLEFDATWSTSLVLVNASDGIILNNAVPQLELENNDYSKVGLTQNFRLHVKYDDAAYSFGDYSATSNLNFSIHWLDSCSPPSTYMGSTQTNPPDYDYAGTSTFELTPFMIVPTECEFYITYSCTNTGPVVDMCTVPEGVFDSAKGDYEFTSTDKVAYPPGAYVFTITGSIGGVDVSEQFVLTLADLCLTPNSITANLQTNPLAYTYTGQLPSASFALTPFTIDPINCQSYVTYTCANTGARSDMCDVTEVGSAGTFDTVTGGYTFYTTDIAAYPASDYTFTITGDFGGITSDTTFVLTLDPNQPCLNPTMLTATEQNNPFDYLYTGSSPSATFNLTPFETVPAECQDLITYECSNYGPRTDMCDVIEGDSAGIFDSTTGNYEFYSEDKDEFAPGAYTFTVTGTLGSFLKTATFQLQLIEDSPFFIPPFPYFDTEESVMKYTVEQSNMLADLTIQLPEVIVQCGTELNIQYLSNLGEAQSFATFDSSAKSILVAAEGVKLAIAQAYDLQIQVQDECGYHSNKLIITVQIDSTMQEESTSSLGFAEQIAARMEDVINVVVIDEFDSTNLDLPTAMFKSMNQVGLVEIEFSKNMYTQFLSQIETQSAQRNSTDQQRQLTASDECALNAQHMDQYWQCEQQEILKVELIQPGDYETERNIQFNWKVVEYSSRRLMIQIEFFNAILVSSNSDPDTLQIQLLSESFFYDLQGLPVRQDQKIYHTIPQQLQLGIVTEILTEVADKTQAATGFVFSSNIFINSALYGTANGLWSLINSQQIIVMLPLYDVMLPPNANIFFTQLMKICAFDPIPMEDWYHEKLQIKKTAALSQNFETIGYDSKWFIVNVGSFAIFLIIFPAIYLLFPMLKPFENNHRIKTTSMWLSHNLIYSAPLRIYTESYLIVFIPAFINIQALEWNNIGEYLNSGSSVFFISAAVLLPIIHYRFLHENKKIIHNDRRIRQRLGNLYMNLKTNPLENGVIGFSVYFYIRRFLLALSIVMMRNFLVGQFFIFVMTTIFQVIFVGIVQPLKTKQMNKSEIHSEIVTMMIMYHIFCFTDWVQDLNIRHYLGYSCLMLNSLHLSVHIVKICRDSFRGLYGRIAISWALYKMKRNGRDKIKIKFLDTGKMYNYRRRIAMETDKKQMAKLRIEEEKKEGLFVIQEQTAEEESPIKETNVQQFTLEQIMFTNEVFDLEDANVPINLDSRDVTCSPISVTKKHTQSSAGKLLNPAKRKKDNMLNHLFVPSQTEILVKRKDSNLAQQVSASDSIFTDQDLTEQEMTINKIIGKVDQKKPIRTITHDINWLNSGHEKEHNDGLTLKQRLRKSQEIHEQDLDSFEREIDELNISANATTLKPGNNNLPSVQNKQSELEDTQSLQLQVVHDKSDAGFDNCPITPKTPHTNNKEEIFVMSESSSSSNESSHSGSISSEADSDPRQTDSELEFGQDLKLAELSNNYAKFTELASRFCAVQSTIVSDEQDVKNAQPQSSDEPSATILLKLAARPTQGKEKPQYLPRKRIKEKLFHSNSPKAYSKSPKKSKAEQKQKQHQTEIERITESLAFVMTRKKKIQLEHQSINDVVKAQKKRKGKIQQDKDVEDSQNQFELKQHDSVQKRSED